MAAQVARTAARPAGVLPPASPFAELLRRSRFASYDPEVKQTYSAPPEYAHRGNWGLKRPIAQKRRNAYITLKSYEDHAQFIEWNNAEAQVRFMKRFEELNVTPRISDTSKMGKTLGSSKSSIWLTDSEFDTAKDKEYRYAVREKAVEEAEEQAGREDVSLEDLGKRGRGKYSGMAVPSTITQRQGPWNYRQPNIDAMNGEEFEAYIERLRTLRPMFYERMREELSRKLNSSGITPAGLQPSTSDLRLAMNKHLSSDHRVFINDYFERQYAERTDDLAAADPESGEALPKDFVQPKIKPQPHRSGGLMYAHPTLLDTFFTTKPKSALILGEETSKVSTPDHNVGALPVHVSFGGVIAELERRPQGTKPLFTYNSGPENGILSENVVKVRVSHFELTHAPNVVGRKAEGLKGMCVKERVTPIFDETTERYNSALLGSFEYVRNPPVPVSKRAMMVDWKRANGHPGYATQNSGRRQSRNNNKNTVNRLRGMVEAEQKRGDSS
ncbi:hypothetical protein FA13DRAFT_1737885 [Coprinellus micaceus]|uniref:Mitochondrial ribosomal protein subunit n=1 Tax=Coprinellus micaceus TaxID=71717 RepID=A0A4Y7SVU6_COPMI|nr:hypothetical protein FA13DRAFT_1737885 [Coprinellus micaceus]